MAVKSKIILEMYYPLHIIFYENYKLWDYCYFEEDTALLQIEIDYYNKQIREILLLYSKKYSEVNENLIINDYTEGKIKINSGKTKCSIFETFIYKNGTKIVISSKKVEEYIKMDKVYFGLSKTKDIVEICVCHMTKEELAHLKNELNLQ